MANPAKKQEEAAPSQIKSILAKVERLEEELSALRADIREIYAEAKSMGLDVKILRRIVSLRKMDPGEREEQEQLLDSYINSIGGL